MKKIKTSDITGGAGMRVKRGTLEHLQSAYTEAIAALVNSRIGDAYDPGKIYLLHGVKNSTTAPIYTISAGAVFYNGEVYLVDAVTFTAGGGEEAVFKIVTTNFTAAIADPVLFSDGAYNNIHEIRKMVLSADISGAGEGDYVDLVEYIETLNYTDVTGDVTAHPNLSSVYIRCLRYPDGTVMIRLQAAITADIIHSSNILSGLPAVGGFGPVLTLLRSTSGGNPEIISHLYCSSSGEISNQADIDSSLYDRINLHYLYKIE